MGNGTPGQSHVRPGGVKFEPSSFKLNPEMVIPMGGCNSQGYAFFQHCATLRFDFFRIFLAHILLSQLRDF
jgi:hypothetical protein